MVALYVICLVALLVVKMGNAQGLFIEKNLAEKSCKTSLYREWGYVFLHVSKECMSGMKICFCQDV